MKRLLVCAATIIVSMAILLVCVRVVEVNKNAPSIPIEEFKMTDWVDLDGTFFESLDLENRNGYAIRVDSAHVMSHDEFVNKYCPESSGFLRGFDEKSIVDLEITFRNTDNESGYISLLPMVLIPDRGNTYYIWNAELWALSEPTSAESFTVRIKPDSEFTTHIPFTHNIFDEEGTTYLESIEDTSFRLVASYSPVRKEIQVIPTPSGTST